MTPFNFFVLFFKRHPLIWVQRSKSMVENFKEQIQVGLKILSSLQSKLLFSPSFITYSSNYLQRKTIQTSVDLKKQTSAMACKGPSIEKQACGNKHSSSRKKKLSRTPANLELSRKDQQYFNFTAAFQALTVGYVKVRQTPQLSSNYQLRPFLSTLHLPVLSHGKQQLDRALLELYLR